MQSSFVKGKGGGDGDYKGQQSKTLYQSHQEMLKNIQSTNIGQPTIVEAQRILKILDGLYENLQKFIYLDADFIQRYHKAPKELINQLSPQGRDLLNRQSELEQKIKGPLSWKQDAIKAEVEMEPEKQQEYQRLMKLLQENFLNLLRHMRSSPDFELIKTLKPGINSEWSDLVHCIHCQRIIMLKKLSTAAEEKEQHKTQLEELKQKIQDLEETCKSSQNYLNQLREERERHSREQKEEIDKLKNDIADVKLDKKQRLDEISNQTKKGLQLLEQQFQQQDDEQDKLFKETMKGFEKLQNDHATEEGQLQKKKTQAENTLEENIKVYDEMMKEQFTEKSDIIKEYNQIMEELTQLKEKIASVEEQQKREKEVEQEFKRKEDAWKLQQDKQQAAIRHIQTIFRAYQQVSKRKKKRGQKGKK